MSNRERRVRTSMFFQRAFLLACASSFVQAEAHKRDDITFSRRSADELVAATDNGSKAARLNATSIRDAECKSCPYGNCLNTGIIRADNQISVQCFTQGDKAGQSITWLRYQFGTKQDQFCYVHSHDMQTHGDYVADLPYCGPKSELHLYLPSVQIKTVYYTECSLCPYRECDGVKYYQPGTVLDVNCQVTDGWNQLGPLHPDGSKTYYRTPDNCYVSVQFVEEAPSRVVNIATLPSPLIQDILPPCGPVPVLRSADRPGLVDDSFVPFRPVSTPVAMAAPTKASTSLFSIATAILSPTAKPQKVTKRSLESRHSDIEHSRPSVGDTSKSLEDEKEEMPASSRREPGDQRKEVLELDTEFLGSSFCLQGSSSPRNTIEKGGMMPRCRDAVT